MAIEITNFNYPTDPNNNINEVYDWLVENASEYFPGGIETEISTKRIACTPIEGDAVTRIMLPFYPDTDSGTGYLRPKYSTEIWRWNPNGTGYSTHSFSKAAKTDSGIMLLSDSGLSLAVSRTKLGNVCACAIGTTYYSNPVVRLIATDLENDRVPITTETCSNYATFLSRFRLAAGMPITILLPIAFTGGTYTENVYVTPFTQANFNGDLQPVLFNGQEYIYDGFVALKA